MARWRPSASAVMYGILWIMIVAVASGFIHLSRQQAKMAELRDTMRSSRMSRQAIMEVDIAVLNALVTGDERSDLSLYNAALARLSGHRASDFPASVVLDGSQTRTMPLVESLIGSWSAMVPAILRREAGAAKGIYETRQVHAKVESIAAAYRSRLDEFESRYNVLQERFDYEVVAVIAMQVLTGIVCLLAFGSATRQSRRDAEARALAVSTSDASRDQVFRLFAMTDTLQSASDHQDANAVLKATASELIPGFGGALYVFNNSRDRLALSTEWARDGMAPIPEAIGMQQCWSLKRGKTQLNLPNSTKLCCEHYAGGEPMLEIPMSARGEILGLLQIFAGGPDAVQRLEEVASLGSALADAMSLALANLALRDKLRSQALRDPLTGLYNRRYMEDALQRLIGLAERDRHELAVIMIDLDHFKRLNDNYGHAKGDSVLRDSASVLLHQVRETDVACRYGGEEMLIVLPNCGLDMAMAKAERIRLAIEALSEPNGAQVTASMGVAAIPATSATMRDLLAAADAALYQAKQDGRNRVVTASLRIKKPTQPLPQLRSVDLMAAE